MHRGTPQSNRPSQRPRPSYQQPLDPLAPACPRFFPADCYRAKGLGEVATDVKANGRASGQSLGIDSLVLEAFPKLYGTVVLKASACGESTSIPSMRAQLTCVIPPTPKTGEAHLTTRMTLITPTQVCWSKPLVIRLPAGSGPRGRGRRGRNKDPLNSTSRGIAQELQVQPHPSPDTADVEGSW